MREEEEDRKGSEKDLIKRLDIKAFTKLLEVEPFADADDSYFEWEEYRTVSALLGKETKPFFSIPP